MSVRVWLALASVLVFGAGVACGVLVNPNWCQIRTESASSTSAPRVVGIDPDYPVYLVTSAAVYDELELSGEQREKLDTVFQGHLDRVQTLRFDLASLGQELRCGVSSVLTDLQLERFDEIRDRYAHSSLRYSIDRRCAHLQQELELQPEQEMAVYRTLFDYGWESRRLCSMRRGGKLDSEQYCRELKAAGERRTHGLKKILSPQQFENYRAIQTQWDALRRRAKSEKSSADAPQP